MISRFFIQRPVFAWVIAILIMLAGAISLLNLPIAQYPDIAPPSIKIAMTYPGASAKTLEDNVTQVVEQQLTGLDGMLYFTSTSSSTGGVEIDVYFDQKTDPDIAQVQVQNQVARIESRLPAAVVSQGILVIKRQPDYLLMMAVYDKTRKATASDLSDWVASNMQDTLSRLPGVGDVRIFGSQHAMRIWLDPAKLAQYSLMPSDIKTAVQSMNTDVSGGSIGAQPAAQGQTMTATVNVMSRLQTADQFKNIIVKTNSDGSVVRLSDVAKVSVGNEQYATQAEMNGYPAAGIAVMLAPGANALDTADLIKSKVAEYQKNMPQGYTVVYPKDNTKFIKISVEEVVKTLFEAILLVVVVMYVFLQNIRATLIPTLTVPVVLLGTFGVLAACGYSVNTLTLFGMVLAIGLLVDDAIVVVENVERVMKFEHLPPKEATIKAMSQISGALIAIAVVLSSVFLPMIFFGGSTGVIYRQFSVTVISAMLLSAVVALTFTPALCATFLRHEDTPSKGFFHLFNRVYSRLESRYSHRLVKLFRKPAKLCVIYGAILAGVLFMFHTIPTSFLPGEDQGYLTVQYTLPAGTLLPQTQKVGDQIRNYFETFEKKNITNVFNVNGFNYSGSGQNAGIAVIRLKDWDQREGEQNTADAVAKRAKGVLGDIINARIVVSTPPAVTGMGQVDGFSFQLEATDGTSRAQLASLRDILLKKAHEDPLLSMVRSNSLPDTSQLDLNVDFTKARVLSLTNSDVTSTISNAWGGSYIDDFLDHGRVKKVYMQGQPDSRSGPDDLNKWFVRGSGGQMAPLSAFTTAAWTRGSDSLVRFNGNAAYEIDGTGAEGISSGRAMAEMEKLQQSLPPGTIGEWSALSLQEKIASGSGPALYGISILVVFLCLAALYESWSVPFCVMLVIPLGVVGALSAIFIRGLYNDVYFQVALLTIIGLSSKNAILIVEFAQSEYCSGMAAGKSALRAACSRLRPILMTSLAFLAGVFPLAIATGAGANSRIAIGTGIIGGTLSATILAVLFIPVFFCLMKKWLPGRTMV